MAKALMECRAGDTNVDHGMLLPLRTTLSFQITSFIQEPTLHSHSQTVTRFSLWSKISAVCMILSCLAYSSQSTHSQVRWISSHRSPLASLRWTCDDSNMSVYGFLSIPHHDGN
jgi:hypothetical protein